MKKAFTLVEILIVVALLGILAAIVIPSIQGHVTEAKESAAKDNLRVLRNSIELYASQHKGVAPGHTSDDSSRQPDSKTFSTQMIGMGKYLPKLPSNPFNGKNAIYFVGNSTNFPAAPFGTTTYGWLYKASTKTIKLNWQGTDSTSAAYFDY
jgi:prepilin-type N-terminal cleavage/methylation domain-containing protein